MTDHLKKAKAALVAARDEEGELTFKDRLRLIDVAAVQAEVSQAESLAAIATSLDIIGHIIDSWTL